MSMREQMMCSGKFAYSSFSEAERRIRAAKRRDRRKDKKTLPLKAGCTSTSARTADHSTLALTKVETMTGALTVGAFGAVLWLILFVLFGDYRLDKPN